MRFGTRRRRRVTGAALAVAFAIPGVAVVSTSAAVAKSAAPTVVTVQSNDNGITVSGANPHQAGTMTFNVSSNAKDGATIDVIKLRPGVSIDQALAEGSKLSGDDPATPAQVRAVDRDVQFIGGVGVGQDQSGSFTETLRAGHYWVVDLDRGSPIAFDVVGRAGRSTAGAASGIVTAGEHRFTTTRRLPAQGNLLFRNRNDEPHFLVIQHVKDGTTDAQMTALFDKFANGQQPSDSDLSILLPEGEASGVLSGGYQEVVTLNLPAGTYDLECFYPDDASGMPHAFMGMHKIVHLS